MGRGDKDHGACSERQEEKLGTATPGVDGEKRRLAELLKETGRARSRRTLTLNFLFEGENWGTAVKRTTCN